MKKMSGDEDSRAKSDEGAVDVLLWIEGLNDVVGLLKKINSRHFGLGSKLIPT